MSESTVAASRTERFDLKTLYETSRLLSASLDLDFVANNLLLSAMSKLLTTRGCVWLFDEQTLKFEARATKGAGGLEKCEANNADFEIDSILTDDAIPEVFASHKIRLVAPILFGERRIGLLGLGGKFTNEPFSNAEIEFVSSLVNMSSAAIENSIVVEHLREANRNLDSKIQQLHTLFNLSQDFNATIDRERLVKLLTLTLMGQMLVSRHLVVLSRQGAVAGAADLDEVETVSSRGVELADDDNKFVAQLFECGDRLDLASANAADGIDTELASWLGEKKIALVLPVHHQGAVAGILCLGYKQTRQPYSEPDIEFLSALANLFIVSMQNSFLVADQIEKERLEEEMRLAREIQEKLQPAKMPEVDGLDLALVAMPSRHVAGDYVDVLALEGERLLVAIGDVTGKGVPASLLMSNLQACLHMVLPMDMTLEEATGHINRVICANTTYDKFITYFHGIYHPTTGKFDYVNAGHNPPILLRANGDVELLEAGGLLLGVMASMPYDLGTVTLEPGDILTMFTDGATEAMNSEEEEFEEDRLTESIVKHRHLEASEVVTAVIADIEEFVGGSPTQFDDLTMIVMKRH